MSTPLSDLPVQVFFTLDYELFLGARSGTVDNCLILPCTKLLELFEVFGVKATVFFDVMYYQRLISESKTTPALQDDLQKIRTNIGEFLKKGHDVELHIHSHWLDAMFRSPSWNLDNLSRYRIHSLNSAADVSDVTSILGCITVGKKLIEELCSPHRSGYRVRAFRAGGWSIEPFEAIKEALGRNSIFIDSSVARGFCAKGEAQQFDFRSHPDQDAWRFENNTAVSTGNGRFLEIPISTFKNSIVNKMKRKVRKLLAGAKKNRPWGDGTAVQAKTIVTNSSRSLTMMSFDGLTAQELLVGLKDLLKRGHRRITLIGHPKNMSWFQMSELKKFLAGTKTQPFRFKTLAQNEE